MCTCMDLHIVATDKNNNCKKMYHRNSNKWFTSRGILKNMHLENILSVKVREKRGYE